MHFSVRLNFWQCRKWGENGPGLLGLRSDLPRRKISVGCFGGFEGEGDSHPCCTEMWGSCDAANTAGLCCRKLSCLLG